MNVSPSHYPLPECKASVTYKGFAKQLTELRFKPDGSFIQKFELLSSMAPIKYHSGHGQFSGWWVTIESTHIFQYETAIRWSGYACMTGHPQSMFISPTIRSETQNLALDDRSADVGAFFEDWAGFDDSAFNRATSILKAEGKLLGTSVAPFSIQAF